MSWTLVETTDSGYKKWRDSYGNSRYQGPDGSFTNQNAWAGTHSQGATSTPEYSGTVTDKTSRTVDSRDDLESYENADDIVYNEPYETGYNPPADFPFKGQGYPIEDYPSETRLDMLIGEIEDNTGYDHYSLTVVVITYADDGTILSRGERHTNLLPGDSIPQLRADWRNMIEEIKALASGYGGAVVLKSKLKMREYQAQFK